MRQSFVSVGIALLLGTAGSLAAQQEVYYDQFDFGTPSTLNTDFWAGERFNFAYQPQDAVTTNTLGVLELQGPFLSKVESRALESLLPSNDYDFYVRVRMTAFEEFNDERNFDIPFRSDGNNGLMFTLDAGNDVIRLRRQGGGFSDLTEPVPHEINPGDEFYIKVSVSGFLPTRIQATVATNPSFTDPIATFDHQEFFWITTSDRLALVGFTKNTPYAFDVDYFSIGEPGYAHPESAWLRSGFPNAPEIARIGDLTDFRVEPGRVVLESGTHELLITPRNTRTVHVEFHPGGVDPQTTSWVDLNPNPYAGFMLVEDEPGEPLKLIGGTGNSTEWIIEATRSPLRLRFLDGEGNLLLEEDDLLATTAFQNTRSLAFELQTDEAIYGVGEHAIGSNVNLNRRGHRFDVRNIHQPPSVLIFPFWVSTRNYGVFIDNPGYATLDFGSGGTETITYASTRGELEYYVFMGTDMYGVMDEYTQLTGRPSLPPRWTLGTIMSKFGYESFAEVQSIINGFRNRNIPLDCVVLDLDWFGIDLMGNLEFQQTPAWANPAQTITGIQAQGIKLIPITEPIVSGRSFNTPELVTQGLVGTRPNGDPYDVDALNWVTSQFPVYILDFSQAAMRNWWGDKHEKLITTYNFDGFWQDLNEPEGVPTDMQFGAGDAPAVSNIIGQQMNKSLFDALAVYRPNGRSFIMSRSGYPGMQAYGAGVWSGDVNSSWFDLRRQKALAQSMGLAGVPSWNSDIGGFRGNPSPELYLRWCQFGLFNPVFRPHSDHADREPWKFGSQVETAMRNLLNLRYQLIPHYYTVAWESSQTGAPIMRPLVMDFPNDPLVRDLDTQFLYGDHLMPVPVTQEGASQVNVYLPEGRWFNWFTGTEYSGGQSLVQSVQLETIPLYVKAPALIPLGPVMQTSDAAPLEEMTLRMFFPESATTASGELYEDDGLTLDYLTGEYALTTFDAERVGENVTLRITLDEGTASVLPTERGWRIEYLGAAQVPLQVRMNETVLSSVPNQNALQSTESSWYYDASLDRLWINLPR
ncbi:MAG: glycoside hydrolase family 31 protein, partial [Candidatus Sumerlaeia bacterium]|nr:glycoside hydrolase family 31 protein [Candidatus Sumerlaeia bacterium]